MLHHLSPKLCARLAIWLPALSAQLAHAEVGPLDCIIQPSEVVEAGAAVAGVIQTIHFDRSDVVKKGQEIARMESSVEFANLNRAKIFADSRTSIDLRKQSLELSRLQESRVEELARVSAIPQQEMDQISTETRIAALQVELEKHNRELAVADYLRARAIAERMRIKSPIEGVIVERYKTEGEYVHDEPVIKIAKLHPLHVEVLVPTNMMGSVKPGMSASVSPSIASNEKLTAIVERVDRVADAASDTFGVRLRLDNPDYSIPAGVRCVVAIDSFSSEEDLESLALTPPTTTVDLKDTQSNWVLLKELVESDKKIRKRDDRKAVNSTVKAAIEAEEDQSNKLEEAISKSIQKTIEPS